MGHTANYLPELFRGGLIPRMLLFLRGAIPLALLFLRDSISFTLLFLRGAIPLALLVPSSLEGMMLSPPGLITFFLLLSKLLQLPVGTSQLPVGAILSGRTLL